MNFIHFLDCMHTQFGRDSGTETNIILHMVEIAASCQCHTVSGSDMKQQQNSVIMIMLLFKRRVCPVQFLPENKVIKSGMYFWLTQV